MITLPNLARWLHMYRPQASPWVKASTLVVVTSWKSQEFGREIFKPRCSLGKPHRAAGEQIGLGDQARTLVGFRRILDDVDRTLVEALNQTLADGRVLD